MTSTDISTSASITPYTAREWCFREFIGTTPNTVNWGRGPLLSAGGRMGFIAKLNPCYPPGIESAFDAAKATCPSG